MRLRKRKIQLLLPWDKGILGIWNHQSIIGILIKWGVLEVWGVGRRRDGEWENRFQASYGNGSKLLCQQTSVFSAWNFSTAWVCLWAVGAKLGKESNFKVPLSLGQVGYTSHWGLTQAGQDSATWLPCPSTPHCWDLGGAFHVGLSQDTKLRSVRKCLCSKALGFSPEISLVISLPSFPVENCTPLF